LSTSPLQQAPARTLFGLLIYQELWVHKVLQDIPDTPVSQDIPATVRSRDILGTAHSLATPVIVALLDIPVTVEPLDTLATQGLKEHLATLATQGLKEHLATLVTVHSLVILVIVELLVIQDTPVSQATVDILDHKVRAATLGIPVRRV
jgi:hypothetical protein